MVCRKQAKDIATTLVVLTLIILSAGFTMMGLFRYIFDLQDDSYVSRNHLILTGNLLQIAALGGSLFILSNSGSGPLQLGLTMAMFFLLILILYLTNFDPSNKASDWTAVVFSVLDVYVKITAVLIGFGVCSDDLTPPLTKISNMITGGKKR
jgi:uncharacterized membrane-anchored protein